MSNAKHELVISFPSAEMMKLFIAQMSDGFGEDFLDFTVWGKRVDNDGSELSHYEIVRDEFGRQVCFVNEIFLD